MLYIHIPYCQGKCIYCDFYSGGKPDWEKYLKAVASELSLRSNELRGDCLSSIYFGGGTPSLIPSEEFRAFWHHLNEILKKEGVIIRENCEVTLEANPEDITLAKIETWKSCGVNRVSIGVQSLNDNELKFLKRRHSADNVLNKLKLLKQHFNNLSVDLIFGIPGQTLMTLDKTLTLLLNFRPEHISAYALTYEPNTPLSILKEKEMVKACNEDEYLEFGEFVNQKLKDEGYLRYEISNYCLPDFHSRHNSGYWEGKKYIGLGPSACSYDGKQKRRRNLPDLKGYLNGKFTFEEEFLTKEQLREEKIMISLRRNQGLDLGLYEKDFGKECLTDLLQKLNPWIDSGDMIKVKERIALTEKGFNIADYIILNLL